MNPRQKRTAVAVAAGSAALLIGLTALGTVAITQSLDLDATSSTQTWEANGGELGEAVYVAFVRDTSGTERTKDQIVQDVQEACRELASDKPGSKIVAEAKDQGMYAITILAGSTNFYCLEFEEKLSNATR